MSSPTASPPLMLSDVFEEEDLGTVLLLVADEMNEGSRPCTFSPTPSSSWLSSPFTVRLSVVFLLHLFSLWFTALGQCSACVSLVDVAGASCHLMDEKKVEGYRDQWGFMGARLESPLLATPMGPPEKTSGLSHKNLTDPRAGPFLERITDLANTRLMGR
ncbi:hypothetical protein D1007_52681 [Hordeum vulgare]|nr:hypothetical protein D1007_52681 [Hordeum vulgare]